MRSRDTLLRLHRFRTEEKRRQVGDIDGMIADLMRKHDDLDSQIKAEEQRTGVVDPNHFNYSLAAKSTSFGKNPKSSLGLSGATFHVHFTGLPFSVPLSSAFTGAILLSVPIKIESRSLRTGGTSAG